MFSDENERESAPGEEMLSDPVAAKQTGTGGDAPLAVADAQPADRPAIQQPDAEPQGEVIELAEQQAESGEPTAEAPRPAAGVRMGGRPGAFARAAGAGAARTASSAESSEDADAEEEGAEAGARSGGDDEVEEVETNEGGFDDHDPLAPAYDLERGAPLDSRTAAAPEEVPWRTDVRSAKEFFNTEALYRFDIIDPVEREPMRGTYRLELKGPQGGIWTITIEDDLQVVNRKEDAETVLVMQHRDFIDIVNGTLNPQLALLAQKVKVNGNVRKGVLLQNILAPIAE